MIGQTISHYRILEKIGEGGMGEVYRAEDTTLKREVAIKVLPERFTKDTERLARFQREAQLLASLNHPNIAAIYGLERADGVRFLVLELVEGETLAERLSKGPLPVEEALEICRQIAEGLEAAHESGVIHRDLKPANVNVTPEGKVKILDFGLAKALEGEIPAANISQSPTRTGEMTSAGVILGTAAYMSPEQTRGKPVDKRTDIWAFSCVLLECLTGEQEFGGETISDCIAKVLQKEPDWEALPEKTPWRIQDLLRRCLQKDPYDRLRHIGDAGIEIREALSEPFVVAPLGVEVSLPRSSWRQVVPWIFVGVIAAFAGIVVGRYLNDGRQELDVTRFRITPPMGLSLMSPPTISPDGRKIVFAGGSQEPSVWLHNLNLGDAKRLNISTFSRIFWSPDSRFIGYFDEQKLKKLDASGDEAPLALADGPAGGGGSWNDEGVIVFAHSDGRIHRVSAVGGESKPVTELDSSGPESHRFPRFLPDNRHFLYWAYTGQEMSGLYVGSLDSEEAKLVLSANYWGASGAAYAAPGYLLFRERDGSLMAQAFDLRELTVTDQAFPVAESVGTFSVSKNGVLLYLRAGQRNANLVWFDRRGRKLGELGKTGEYANPALSPDETRLAVDLVNTQTGTRDIWLFDLTSGSSSRLPFDPAEDVNPVWSPDGGRIIFGSYRKGSPDLYQRMSNGLGEAEPILLSDERTHPEDWSSDGQFLLYNASSAGKLSDVRALTLSGDREAFTVLSSQFREEQAQISPSRRWIAYTSNESGSFQVYVQGFPNPREKVRISTAGGIQPRWRSDGKELFYLDGDELMAVEVESQSSPFRAGVPTSIFKAPFASFFYRNCYVVASNGERFLMGIRAETGGETIVVLNWFEELKRLAATDN